MAIRVTPWAIDSNTHPAQDARLALAHSLGCDVASSFAGGVPASGGLIVDPGHGVTTAGALKVTQNGTPNMSVLVAIGGGLIRGTQSAVQGVYALTNDASTNLSISAANASNPRRDLVILQARDNAFDAGGINDGRLVVVAGTPAASPVDPSLASYPNALVLARVAVAANATSITNANITDLRSIAAPWASSRGEAAQVAVAAGGPSGIGATATDLTFGGTPMSVTFSTVAGRKYKITGNVRAAQNTSSGVNELQIRDGSGTVLGKSSFVAAAGAIVHHNALARVVPASAGSVTYKLSMSTTVGTTDPFGAAGQSMILIVEDIGGALT